MWAPLRPHLFVLLEGDRPRAGGVRLSLQGVDEVIIGRGPHRSFEAAPDGKRVSLQLSDRRVSARHARLFAGSDGWRIEDLRSTNGSRLNGRAVAADRLVDGDLIQIGSTVLRLRTDRPTPTDTPRVTEGDRERFGVTTLIPALAAELRLAEKAARSALPILLLGETGTGKEVAARAVHEASGRLGPFVAVNCAALPQNLIESQLFGHTRGSFSGATRDEIGLIRSAHEGTLFLDEIGDLPLAAQAVLLRVLQEGEVVPVGSTRAVSVDVRVVSATHQPIDAMIAAGTFRSDLLARLQGFTHRLWPLRDRRDDLGLLVSTILTRSHGGPEERVQLTGEAAFALAAYEYPLNIRELAQVLARAIVLADKGIIEVAHLPPELAAQERGVPEQRKIAGALSENDAALKATIVAELQRAEGNVSAVARAMNRAPMQVYRWLRRFAVDPEAFR